MFSNRTKENSIEWPIAKATTRSLVVLVNLLLVLSSLSLIPSQASSDPVVVANPDNTVSVVWNFDDPDNFTLLGAAVGGGFGTLERLNESTEEHTQASYDLGLRKENISTSVYPDSIVLDPAMSVTSVMLQPGPEGFDTHIDEGAPDANFGDLTVLSLNPDQNNVIRPLIRFDLTSIPANAVIHDAMLWLYLTSGIGPDVVLTILALNGTFEEMEATWNRAAIADLWTVPGGDYNAVPFCGGTVTNLPGWYGFDVSKLVRHWVQGDITNDGLIVVPVERPVDATKQFVSSDETSAIELRPRLALNYSIPSFEGVYESRPIGPGTNAFFTLANWTSAEASLATDEFPGNSLDPRWSWVNDPSEGAGSYDVGITRPGWLHVLGETRDELKDEPIPANFLYQNITGDFIALSALETSFSSQQMSAGLLMADDGFTWVGVSLKGSGGAAKIVTEACEGGVVTQLASIGTPSASGVYLRMDKIAGSVALNYSLDGMSWMPVFTYVPLIPFTGRVMVGLAVFPGTSTSNPIAEFDYFRIDLEGTSFGVDVSVRCGNSTLVSDPSWGLWSAPLPASSGSAVGMTGRFVQYRVVLISPVDWYSPMFSWFLCHYELYATVGMIGTDDYAVADLGRWLTLTTYETTDGPTTNSVNYSYSTDGGFSWSRPFSGGVLGISSTEPNMKIRIMFQTNDTLLTPAVDSVVATYGPTVSDFYVVASATAIAGELFTVRIYAKDAANETMTMWSGLVTLHAMNAMGTADATAELSVTNTAITGEGYVTVADEQYFVAETIRIRASSAGISGLSGPVTVVPGPVASIEISPYNTTMIEYTQRTYLATAYDAFGNLVTDTDFSWSVTSFLGSINTTVGASVRLTVGEEGSEGDLTVTAESISASIHIVVIPLRFPPVFTDTIPLQTQEEDYGQWILNIEDYVSDSEDPDTALRWFITGENIVSISGENVTGNLNIVFSTIEDMYGTDILILFVVDSDGMAASTVFEVMITPVNDGPTIDQIDPLVVHFDDPYVYDFTYYVHDVDNTYDELTLNVDSANAPYCTVEGLRIVFTYPESFLGTNRTVIVTVTDPAGESSSTAVVVRVSDDHVPVQFSSIPPQVLYEGQTLSFVVTLNEHFFDPDHELLYYACGFVHVSIDIHANSSVSITAPDDWYGVEYVIFQAIDPWGARAEGVMEVTVLQVNHPPVIAKVPDLMVRYDEQYDFDLTPYASDLEDSVDQLYFSSSDAHVWFTGAMMHAEYPFAMLGSVNPVNLTVSDGELSDWWIVNITVSDNHPPVLTDALPDHSFQEDVEVRYPISQGLEHYFWDEEDGSELMFDAFCSAPEVESVAAEGDGTGEWYVSFETVENYYGGSSLTVRAIDSRGAIAERTVSLIVTPVPDAPVLTLPDTFNVTEGVQIILGLGEYVYDPDSFLSEGDFGFEVLVTNPVGAGTEYTAGIRIVSGMLVFSYPEGTIDRLATNPFTIMVQVTDQDGKMAEDEMQVKILRQTKIEAWNSLLWGGIIAAASVASGTTLIAWKRRKRPFIIRDLMLIHNDGFLMGRYAHHAAGEIDEDVLSGMLTAVLNFVEDSMATSAEALKTFGFKGYQVLVKRGSRTFVAVVYDGDLPQNIDSALKELVGTVERVYRKKLASWTGDIETDFAGLEVLIQSFVRDHSRKGRAKAASIWRIPPRKRMLKKATVGPKGTRSARARMRRLAKLK